jgi:hypothetical protein
MSDSLALPARKKFFVWMPSHLSAAKRGWVRNTHTAKERRDRIRVTYTGEKCSNKAFDASGDSFAVSRVAYRI